MPILQITLDQSYLGKTVSNVFHYFSLSWENYDVDAITHALEQFEANVLGNINDLQTVAVSNELLRAVEVTNTNLQSSISPAGNGDRVVGSSSFAPRQFCIGYRVNVGQTRLEADGTLYSGTRRIGSGYKYFCGLVDEDADGQEWAAAFDTIIAAANVEQVLAVPLDMSAVGAADLIPCVYGRPLDAIPSTPNKTGKPARPGVYAPVTVAAASSGATWLHSRK